MKRRRRRDSPSCITPAARCRCPPSPSILRQFDSWFSLHTYSHNVALIASLANLLGAGVPVRFPRLTMIFIEAGLSWVAHALMRFDWAWRQHNDGLTLLTEPPSAYLRRMYFATQPIEEPESLADMADIIRIIGEETVLFASDYPHHDFDHPKKVYDIPVPPRGKAEDHGRKRVARAWHPDAGRAPARARARWRWSADDGHRV